MSQTEQAPAHDSLTSIIGSLRALINPSPQQVTNVTERTPNFHERCVLRSDHALNHMLSISPRRFSTPRATRDEGVRGGRQFSNIERLGKGQCGTVWTLFGTTPMALKVMNDKKKMALWNDCCMHKLIQEAFANSPLEFHEDINIPTFGDWIPPANRVFWRECMKSLPKGSVSTYALLSEKIHSLPYDVRSALVDVFAPESVKRTKGAFLTHPDNQHCLIRLYLGRRMQRLDTRAFKLGNFDLMINEMEHLRLDTGVYATVMANALALLHWKAGVDANDVEFVLGTAPNLKKAGDAAGLIAGGLDSTRFICQTSSLRQTSIGMWLLDFNECQSFTHDAIGVVQLQRAFYFNDPYYPRPGSKNVEDKALWDKFKTVYLTTSAAITNSGMPLQFILAVEAEGKRRSQGAPLFE